MSDTNLLIKLFDTLKDASTETQRMCYAMLENQNNIVNNMQNIPIQELRDALKEHSKESTDEIDACTETVETKTNKILDKVNIIDTKIGKMITVVLVAFSLLAISFIVGRLSMESSTVEKKIEQKEDEEHKKVVDAITNSMKEEFDKIRKEIRKLHPEEEEEKKKSTN